PSPWLTRAWLNRLARCGASRVSQGQAGALDRAARCSGLPQRDANGGLSPNREGMLRAATTGVAVGLFIVLAVRAIAAVFPQSLPRMLHPPGVWSALSASTAGAFGEEIL